MPTPVPTRRGTRTGSRRGLLRLAFPSRWRRNARLGAFYRVACFPSRPTSTRKEVGHSRVVVVSVALYAPRLSDRHGWLMLCGPRSMYCLLSPLLNKKHDQWCLLIRQRTTHVHTCHEEARLDTSTFPNTPCYAFPDPPPRTTCLPWSILHPRVQSAGPVDSAGNRHHHARGTFERELFVYRPLAIFIMPTKASGPHRRRGAETASPGERGPQTSDGRVREEVGGGQDRNGRGRERAHGHAGDR